MVAVASLWNLSPARSPFWYDFTSGEVGQADLEYRGTLSFPVHADFMPKWVGVESKHLALPNVAALAAAGATTGATAAPPRVEVLEETLTSLRLRVHTAAAASLKLHKFYFPGWQATADGVPVTVSPDGPLGLATIAIPAGEHDLLVSFGETPLRVAANLVSLLGGAVIVLGLAQTRAGRRLLLVGAVAALTFAGLLWRSGSAIAAVFHPVPLAANFDDQIELRAYHAHASAVRAGDAVRIRLYWFVRQTVRTDYKVFIHLG